MKNDEDKNNIIGEINYDDCYKKAVKFSVFCIALLIIFSFISMLFIKYKQNLFCSGFGIFNNSKLHKVQILDVHEEINNSHIQFKVIKVTANNNGISVFVSGKNTSQSQNRYIDGNDFILTSYNVKNDINSDEVQHYFTYEQEQYTVIPQQSLVYELKYEIDNINEKIKNGEVFSLSVFKNENIEQYEMYISKDDITISNIEDEDVINPGFCNPDDGECEA